MKTISAIILLASLLANVPNALAHVDRRRVEDIRLENNVLSWPVPHEASTVTVEACVAMPGVSEGRGVDRHNWSLTMTLVDGTELPVDIGWGNSDYGDFSDTRYLYVTCPGIGEARFSKNVDLYRGDNTLVVEVEPSLLTHIYIGDDFLNHVGDIRLPVPLDSVSLGTTQVIDIIYCCVESTLLPNLESGLDEDELDAACAPGQGGALGLWHSLDRDNDASYARPGGNYSLAVVEDKSRPGQLLIIYIAGARVNSGSWHRGMVKGRLIPTAFDGRYKLQWYGADMNLVRDEAHAIVEDGLLTLKFPLLHTQLRYSR